MIYTTVELDPTADTKVETSAHVYFTRNRLAVRFEQVNGAVVAPLDRYEACGLRDALNDWLDK